MKKAIWLLTFSLLVTPFLIQFFEVGYFRVSASGSSTFKEEVDILVNCDTASVTVGIDVSSDNNTLVHFPSEVDMFDPHLQNAIAVMVSWAWVNETAYIASLDYTFNNVSLEEARVNADAITPSMSAAFGVSFVCLTNYTTNGDAVVGYGVAGYSDVANLVEWLISICVAGDVNGFSDALPGFVAKMSVPWVLVGASKEAGSFNWDTSIGSLSEFSIPPGSNSHTIDVLDLLGVSSLAPSPYGFNGNSTITLVIMSSTSISFVSCEPPLAPTPGEKGWTLIETLPGYLYAMFGFGSDPSPVTQLSLTFSSKVGPGIPVSAGDLAAAMDVDSADLINATFSVDGMAGAVVNGSVGFLAPIEGDTFVMISSGNAKPFAFPEGWIGIPDDFLSVDNGNPSGTGPLGADAYDIVTLNLTLRAPDWAKSFSFNFRFMSEEYPEYVGSLYNDFFSCLLGGTNIVFDTNGSIINVNNNFFDPTITPEGTVFNGTTVLLTSKAPITGGTTFELDFVVGDIGDSIYDTAVFLDNFNFSTEEVEEPVTGPTIWSSDSLGNEKDTFAPTETVYVTVPATGKNVTLYIVADKDVWNDGDLLTDVSDGAEQLALDPGPGTQVVQAWGAPLTSGSYDIVEDTNNNGLYDAGVDGIDSVAEVGFAIEYAPPVASFTYSPSAPYTGEPVTFNASASYDPDGSIVSYFWDFGDGNTGTEVNPSHTYAQAGTYLVTLTVTDDYGATDTTTVPIGIGTGRIVFEEAHLPLYTVGGNPAYETTGAYSEFADYLIANGYGVSTIDPGTIIDAGVLAPVDVLVIVAPQNSYSTSEMDAIEAWVNNGGRLLLISEWGSYGAEASTIATRFSITLVLERIFDFDENVGYEDWPYYDGANLLSHPVTAGVARVEMYASDGITNAPADEIPLIVTDTDGTGTWDDGSPALGVSLMSALDGGTAGSGRLIVITDSNIWDSAYDNDDDGDLDFYDSDNEVLGLNAIDWLAAALNEPPVASFTHSPESLVYAGEVISFNASGSYDPDGSIVSYEWNFGDDSTGSGEIVIHSYADDGVYTVTLTVTDDDFETAVASVDITVLNRPPVAFFTENATTVDTREAIFFDASDSYDPDGSIDSYSWDFGDGTTDSGITVIHSYAEDGTYPVTLTVTDDDGATNSATSTKYVVNNPPYQPQLSITPDLPVQDNDDLIVTVTGPTPADPDGDTVTYIYKWLVDIGTGEFVDDELAGRGDHTGNIVPAADTVIGDVWRVEVTPVDEHEAIGLSAIATWQPVVPPDATNPVADAGPEQTVVEDTVVSFDAGGSSDNVGIVSYEWDFGDGTTGAGKTVIHTYAEPEAYTVTLTVKDAAGNSNTDSTIITVQRDTDGDGIGNNSDTDDDNDSVLDVNDAFPLDPTETVDTDGDGVGDNADTDDDGDGIPDEWEIDNGLDPLDAQDASLDTDNDGLTSLQEYMENKDPNVYDTEVVREPRSAYIVGQVAVVAAAATAATAALASFGGLGQAFNSAVSKLPIPDKLKDFLQLYGEKIFETVDKVKLETLEKAPFITKGDLAAFGISALTMTIVFGFVEANGLPSFLNPSVLAAVIPAVLISVCLVSIAGEISEALCAQTCRVYRQYRLWIYGLVAFLISGLLFLFPFASPGITRYQSEEISNKTKGLIVLSKMLVLLTLTIPFAGLYVLGFKIIGDAGLLLTLMTVCYSLVPLKPLAGKAVFDYRKEVSLTALVSAGILFYSCIVNLLPHVTYLAVGVVSVFLAAISLSQLRKAHLK